MIGESGDEQVTFVFVSLISHFLKTKKSLPFDSVAYVIAPFGVLSTEKENCVKGEVLHVVSVSFSSLSSLTIIVLDSWCDTTIPVSFMILHAPL